MDWYRQEFDIPQTASTQQTLHLLASEQLIIAQDAGNYAITNLDALLFARDFNDFPTVARKALRVIRYDGPSPISPSRSKTFFSGYAKLDQALEYVEALLPEQEVIQGARRVTLRMFPHMALRELMANMLIHQDFSITSTGPMICIFDGRIEFTNPGSSLVDVARLLNDPPSFAQRENGSYLPMTNASLRERFDLPASGASQVSRLIKTCISSNLLKIADPDAGKRYVRYLPYWA